VLLAVRQNQLPPGLSSKLSAKYMGRFSILETVGVNAFKLDLPADLRIHPVFHVSQLKPYVSSTNPTTESTNPGPLFTGRQGNHPGQEEIWTLLALSCDMERLVRS
jgi:hypothetical protein